MIVQEQFHWPAQINDLSPKILLTGDVCEIEKEEKHHESYSIISLELQSGETYTPKEVIQLGKILIELGKRVKKEYTSKGKFKSKEIE